MAVEDWLGIVDKALRINDRLTDEYLEVLNRILEKNFKRVAQKIKKIQLKGQDGSEEEILILLSKLKQNTIARQLFKPADRRIFKKQFAELITNVSRVGIAYADEMIEALENPPQRVRSFGRIAIEAAAVAAEGSKSLTKYSQTTAKKIIESLTNNLLEGGSTQQLAKRLEGHLDFTRARANTIARTSTLNAFNKASGRRYKQYGTKYVQLIAIVDSRTTPWCRYRHLKVVPLKQANLPPFHFNCRTVHAPVDPSWLTEEDLKWMNQERNRASKTGLSSPGKAPFDTTKPNFIDPKVFVKRRKASSATRANKASS